MQKNVKKANKSNIFDVAYYILRNVFNSLSLMKAQGKMITWCLYSRQANILLSLLAWGALRCPQTRGLLLNITHMPPVLMTLNQSYYKLMLLYRLLFDLMECLQFTCTI